MDVDRELTVEGDPKLLQEFAEELCADRGGVWQRYESDVSELRENLYSYSNSDERNLPLAVVWLAGKGTSQLYVSTITPNGDDNSMTTAECNAVLQDFFMQCAEPLAREKGLRITLTNDEQSLEELAGRETADALESFSSAANKATGSSHPLDAERWRTFIIKAHKNHSPLDVTMLMRWLAEDEHWSDEFAYKLGGEYEQGRELLAQYDRS